jgi:DNA-directed RNA polymerase subunit M/transcription elongation factor TFIIS
MKFCERCNNMLYLRVAQDVLRYYCKSCEQVPAENASSSGGDNPIILHEEQEGLEGICVHNKQTDDLHTPYKSKYIAYDPTLPRTHDIHCVNPSCQRPSDKLSEVIYVLYDSDNMKYIYYCCHCGTFWRTKQEQNSSQQE